MRKAVEDYIRICGACQRSNEDREFTAPLGEVDIPEAPFLVTTVNVTVPYPVTSRRNQYFLTFIGHYTKYVEAFPIPDQMSETCAQV